MLTGRAGSIQRGIRVKYSKIEKKKKRLEPTTQEALISK